MMTLTIYKQVFTITSFNDYQDL